MRIAIVGNFALSGKQTMIRRALPMAEALVAAGHSVRMILPMEGVHEAPGPPERNGVLLQYVTRPHRWPGLPNLWQLLMIVLVAWRWRPAAVYVFKPIAYSGAFLWLFWLLRRLGIYRGSILLDTDDWEGHGGWNDRMPFPFWLKALISWQEKWSLRHADVVTAASRTLVDLAEGVGAATVVYVPNAVSRDLPGLADPLESNLRVRLGLDGRSVVLVYSRFVEYRLQRLLDTFEAITREDPNALMLVVGTGMDGEERALERMARTRGLDGRILLTGWVESDQLASYLRVGDIALYLLDDNLLNRSKCPVKLLDLLAAGVPVVADSVGQAAEYISDGKTGILVTPEDPRAMAAAALHLLRQPERRMEMSREAKLDARSRLSWEVWGAEVRRALETAHVTSQPRPQAER